MSQTRYCSTCGTLLTEGAAICGECGARYQASPYERRATDAPGAWSQAPKPRSRDLGNQEPAPVEDEGVELISRDALSPKQPGATTVRSPEQYDQVMVSQSPMHQNGPGESFGQSYGPGSPGSAPAPGTSASATGIVSEMEPPLDGCAPASPVKRLVAALIDGVIATVVLIPLIIGIVLLVVQDPITLLPQILVGVGVALPAAYTVLMIWLSGAKGITIGKVILGLRITRFSQGGPLGFLRALGRWALYAIIWWLMALSIFLDPKKMLRGFHDRAIDSVVVDVKAGRNPLHPRPDDFERASDEQYLGAPSVPVSTHENLLSEPGAAWSHDPQGAAGGQSPASSAWGSEQPAAASPYAPPASSGSSAPDAPIGGSPWSSPPPMQEPAAPGQHSAGEGWAPPPVEPVGQSAWGQQAPTPSSQQSEQQWGHPAPIAQPEQQWGQPAPSAQQSEQWGEQPPAQPVWGPPPSAPEREQPPVPQYGEPEEPYQNPAPQGAVDMFPQPQQSDGWDQGAPATATGRAGGPNELTGDAWGGHDDGVDEQTRMSTSQESIEDLEQTRVSAVKLPAVKKLRLTADDGSDRVVDKAVVIGRNPAAEGQEMLFVLKDDTRSVSKTHLHIDGTGDDITVIDLGSTNGSSILREDGSREELVPNTPTVLPSGAKLTLGDRTLSVEREQ